MQISLLADMVPTEFPAAPLINNNFYYMLVFLYLQVAGWGWTVHLGDNFHIFQHLNTAFAYTQHQRQAIRGNPRGWGSWKLQILLIPGWYGDFYTPFRHKIEQPPGQARPVPSLSGLCLPTEHQSSPTPPHSPG